MTDKPQFDVKLALESLELGKVYDFGLAMTITDKDGKEKKQEAKLANYKFETKLFTCEDKIIHRFCSVFNDSFIMVDEKGEILGDFRGWEIICVNDAKPHIAKHICMTEEELLKIATEKFGDKASEFVESLKAL